MHDDKHPIILKLKCMFLIILCYPAGFAYAYGNPCDTAAPEKCYGDLVHYETLAIPLFGHDDESLDEICRHINTSFDCVEQYFDACHGAPECDKNCTSLIGDIVSFSRNTGLRKLASDLCDEYSIVRQIYLENAMCLEDNADLYASCHNDSQKSQHFLNTIPGVDAIEKRCCFFTWYSDCFTNATRDHCGENATFFVSFAVHNLIGNMVEHLCDGVPSNCTSPPLPPDEDNEIDTTGAATIKYCTVNLIVISCLYILFSKYYIL